MEKQLVRISKFLSLVLRHEPEAIGLSLDEAGWAGVEELIAAANHAGTQLSRDMLCQVVEQCEKKRFTFSQDALRIRANYGHSIPIVLGLEPTAPPTLLYHGTAARFLESIKTDGLLPRGRNYVHLSPDIDTATAVGRRHGRPVVLNILAQDMHEDSFAFYLSESLVWLTDRVPPRYIGHARPTHGDEMC